MPVIPSFSAFARGPDLVGARSRADALAEQRRQTNLNFLASMQKLQLDREQLAQQAYIAEMQMAASAEVARQNALRQQSQLAIDKAYKEAVIGLQGRELDMKGAAIQMEAQQAAQQMAARQRLAEKIANKVPVMQALAEEGPGLTAADFRAFSSSAKPTYSPEDVSIFEREGQRFFQAAPTEIPRLVPGQRAHANEKSKQELMNVRAELSKLVSQKIAQENKYPELVSGQATTWFGKPTSRQLLYMKLNNDIEALKRKQARLIDELGEMPVGDAEMLESEYQHYGAGGSDIGLMFDAWLQNQ
jgi:hypothetical protein